MLKPSPLDQRSSTQFLGTQYPEEFSYNPNQTHLKRPIKLPKTAWKLQTGVLKPVVNKLSGEWVPRSRVEDLCPRWRFNISLLSNQTFITSLKEYIKEFLEINMPSDVDPQILWETTKCAIRVSVYLSLLLLPKRKLTSLHN